MTQLTFHNSLSKQKEVFKPIHPLKVGLYSCGLTVYDRAHIGNLRSFITADLLQRVIRHVGGIEVNWVMNVTDIDDKMIVRANDESPDAAPKEALQKLAHTYEEALLKDLALVNVQRSDIAALPRATEHIAEMQAIISDLLKDDIAYIADGSIYFSIQRYEASGKSYGLLTNVDYDPQARIDDQDQKEGAGDFALWKATQPNDPAWDFEIDGTNYAGRPGWHIECSAMSTKYLGAEFDLHTGGIDLKFPHHENEIAQCNGTLARYWLHNEHLHVNGEKMAKSRKNFYTLEDVAEHGNPLAFRLMVLSSHYRSRMDYSHEGLADAEARLKTLREWASKTINNSTASADQSQIKAWKDQLDAALADDLGTPAAQAIIAEAERSGIYGNNMVAFIEHLDAIYGLQLLTDNEAIVDARIMETLNQREAARADNDFTTSDELRDILRERGIGVEDTPAGQIIWRLQD